MELSKLLIALDNGKRNMKAMSENGYFCYTNKYSGTLTEDERLLGKNTYNVVYDGKGYTVGENGETSDLSEGKASEPQIVQALTAITRIIEPNEKRKIVLMYGESVSMYFDAEHKLEIKSKLEKAHDITVNNQRYTFEIETVQVLPEGLGHILLNFSEYQGVQYVVDIGGCTVNLLKVMNGRPDINSCMSFRLGVNNVVANIAKEIKDRKIGEQPTDLIYQFLTNRKTCKNVDILRAIDDVVKKQIIAIDDKLIALGINLKELLLAQPVTFIGGGSILFKDVIEDYYRNPKNVTDELVVKDALYANVKGFYLYGEAKFL